MILIGLARHAINHVVHQRALASTFPTGIFLINVAGSFAIGLVAGALGAAVWYGVRRLTGYEIGLIAIAVGFLVGAGVRAGSGGRGGRVTSRELVDAYLARIAAYDQQGPTLNAISVINRSARREAEALDAERKARGPRGPLRTSPVEIAPAKPALEQK